MLQAQTDCSVQQQPRVVGCGRVGSMLMRDRGRLPALRCAPTRQGRAGQDNRSRDRTLKPTCTCLYLYRLFSRNGPGRHQSTLRYV